MDLCWTVLTDGRKEYIKKALPTWFENLSEIDQRFIIDDSGDIKYRRWLSKTFKSFEIIPVGNDRCGYDAGMQKIFSTVKELKYSYCFHIEDDFILRKSFNIQDLKTILKLNKNMSQVSLMRGPWFHNEVQHGGVVNAIKASNKNAKFLNKNKNGLRWVQHQAYWTCNPNLFPSWIIDIEWPSGNWSESRFSKKIFDKGKVAGIFENENSWPFIEHIGGHRNGTQY